MKNPFTLCKTALQKILSFGYRCKAFTLAEVLITLGIIGIVAAMTLPSLLNRYNERVTISKLKQMQSTLHQAITLAEEEHGKMLSWGVENSDTHQAVISIADKLKPYFKIGIDCGTSNQSDRMCFYNGMYKYLNNTNYVALGRMNGQYSIKLANGGSLLWYTIPTWKGVYFVIDTNDTKLPNTVGIDTFWFVYINDRLYPLGTPETRYYDSCNKNNTGWGCAYYILTYENMDYLH